MILRAYSVYDNKALQYHSPFFAVNDATAIRSITDAVNDPQTNLSRHPRDFSLFLVGQWDDNSGQFMPLLPLVHVTDCIALVAEQRQADFFTTAAGVSQPSANGRDR